MHITQNVGVSGADKVYWAKAKNGKEEYWCKQAVAFFGSISEDCIGLSPFDPKFHDPYVEGKGSTKEEALAAMQLDIEKTADMLWHE